MFIAIDFDGTCVTHEYPIVGQDIGAIPVLKRLVKEGHQLILYTMRSNVPSLKGNGKDIIDVVAGNYLQDAVQWFEDNGISLFGVNTNPTQKSWTSSPKAYAHLYIDDAALGTPLIYSDGCRPFVDWQEVEKMLERSGVLAEEVYND